MAQNTFSIDVVNDEIKKDLGYSKRCIKIILFIAIKIISLSFYNYLKQEVP